MKIIEVTEVERKGNFVKVKALVESGLFFKKRAIREASARHLSTLDEYVEWEWLDHSDWLPNSTMTSKLRKFIYKEKFKQ